MPPSGLLLLSLRQDCVPQLRGPGLIKSARGSLDVGVKALWTLRRSFVVHPLIGTAALALLVAGSAFFVQSADWVLKQPPLNAPLSIILALLPIIPLAWRRSLLVAGLIIVTGLLVTLDAIAFTREVNLSTSAAIMAVFSAAAYGGRRRNLACVASIVVFNGGLFFSLSRNASAPFLSGATLLNVSGLLWSLLTFVATWWFANNLRRGREQTALLR